MPLTTTDTTILSIETEVPAKIISEGMQGVPGVSAYGIAVKNGYVGTETEWLAFIGGSGGGTMFYTGTTPPVNTARPDDLYLDLTAKEIYKWVA